MKDRSRKNRDWDNDNFIMSKHGKSIRENIHETLVKAGIQIATYRAVDRMQKNYLKNAPADSCGNC